MTAEVYVPEVVQPHVIRVWEDDKLLGRQDLIGLPIPEATRTHVPIPHAAIVESIIQSLAFRNIEVERDEYALSKDAMRMFGVMTLNMQHSGVKLAMGLRNSNDKSFSLAITVGFRVTVCSNLLFAGDFTAVVAKKHTKNFELADTVALAVEKMQRGFEPMGRRIDAWRGHSLPDSTAKNIIYAAFIEDGLPIPKHLAKVVHRHYFDPSYPEFEERTMWSLQNAFTSSLRELEPMKAIPLTAKLAGFLEKWN